MPPIQLVIQLDAAGKVSVSGPIDNKVLCYGLLESAKDAIREYQAANAKLVQPVTSIPRLAGNGG